MTAAYLTERLHPLTVLKALRNRLVWGSPRKGDCVIVMCCEAPHAASSRRTCSPYQLAGEDPSL